MAERDGDPTEGGSDRAGGGRSGRVRRWPRMVIIGLALLAVGWTTAWNLARNRVSEEIDRQIERLERAGMVVACPDRTVSGFPFRFEVGCGRPGLSIPARGVTMTAEALRVVAQAWDPFLVILEIDGPITADDGRMVLDGMWRRFAMSLRWTRQGAERLSLAADDVKLSTRISGTAASSVPAFRLVAAHLEAHGRPSGEGGRDLDVAVATSGAAIEIDGKRVGPERSDLQATTTLVAFLPPGPGEAMRAFAARGGRIDPIRFTLASGGLTLAGKGALTVLPDGLVDGSIGVAASGIESLAFGGARALGSEATTIASGFLLLGRPSTDPDLPGRRLDLVVDHGRPRLGRVAFPPIAPLF